MKLEDDEVYISSCDANLGQTIKLTPEAKAWLGKLFEDMKPIVVPQNFELKIPGEWNE